MPEGVPGGRPTTRPETRTPCTPWGAGLCARSANARANEILKNMFLL